MRLLTTRSQTELTVCGLPQKQIHSKVADSPPPVEEDEGEFFEEEDADIGGFAVDGYTGRNFGVGFSPVEASRDAPTADWSRSDASTAVLRQAALDYRQAEAGRHEVPTSLARLDPAGRVAYAGPDAMNTSSFRGRASSGASDFSRVSGYSPTSEYGSPPTVPSNVGGIPIPQFSPTSNNLYGNQGSSYGSSIYSTSGSGYGSGGGLSMLHGPSTHPQTSSMRTDADPRQDRYGRPAGGAMRPAGRGGHGSPQVGSGGLPDAWRGQR